MEPDDDDYIFIPDDELNDLLDDEFDDYDWCHPFDMESQ
jgi:hypothetical protein